MVEAMAVQRDGVGILHQPCGRTDDAGDADPDSGGHAQSRFRLPHQAGDGVQRLRIAVRSGDTMTQRLGAIGFQDRDLNLGAAQVDADSVLGHGVR